MNIPFSNRTEKHTLSSILPYCPSHHQYCTKHQPPLQLNRVAILIRNIFARDTQMKEGSQGLWVVGAA